MKKTLATLLVAGALAAAGLSASAAVSAPGDNSGQGSVVAVGLVAELHSEELTETAQSNGGYRKETSDTHRSYLRQAGLHSYRSSSGPLPNQRLDLRRRNGPAEVVALAACAAQRGPVRRPAPPSRCPRQQL